MKLTEMRRLLAERGIRLTKSLGQNFMHDANQLRRLVKAARLAEGDHVLEIGPGLGPITELLLAARAHVLAIEKDQRLAGILRERFPSPNNLTVVQTDAMEYLKARPQDWHEWIVVSNLPFTVASPLLVELALTTQGPRRVVVTLQREVAQRLAAQPGEANYGMLTLLVKLSYELEQWFKIPASCFFPEPAVDSAGVILSARRTPALPTEYRELFVRLVKRGFSQRRKMMLKLLTADWPRPHLLAAFEEIGLSPQARAEEASLRQFAGLAKLLAGGFGGVQPI